MKHLSTLAAAVFIGLGCFVTLHSQTAQTGPSTQAEQLTQEDALRLVRSINTAQVQPFVQEKRYLSLEELLSRGGLPRLTALATLTTPVSSAVKDYNLVIFPSTDGKRYHLSLVPKSGCEPAFFSSESGIIFVGKALGCPAN